MVAAGSQERRMAERQANGRPGTDKGMGAGTLEAWVRGPGRGQCCASHCGLLFFEPPPPEVPRRLLSLITFAILCCPPIPHAAAFRAL